ncbi:MAG: hypothetical protein JNL70_26415 [Saprospiraceae bacterium]|nr:hypothetical protein [Saprospiraceae bacterium]
MVDRKENKASADEPKTLNTVQRTPDGEEVSKNLEWLERYHKGEISEDELQKLDEKLAEQECNVCYAAQLGYV